MLSIPHSDSPIVHANSSKYSICRAIHQRNLEAAQKKAQEEADKRATEVAALAAARKAKAEERLAQLKEKNERAAAERAAIDARYKAMQAKARECVAFLPCCMSSCGSLPEFARCSHLAAFVQCRTHELQDLLRCVLSCPYAASATISEDA